MAYGTTTRAMLVDAVSVEFAVSKADAMVLVDFIFSRIADDLSNGSSVNITNFGTFSVKKHRGHFVQSGNQQVGRKDENTEYRRIDDYNVVRFVPSVRLKDRVNETSNATRGTLKPLVLSGNAGDKSVVRGRGRPKKVLSDEDKLKRAIALQMIRDDMNAGVAITTKSVADKVGVPVHLLTKWRNEADLSVKDVKKRIAEGEE